MGEGKEGGERGEEKGRRGKAVPNVRDALTPLYIKRRNSRKTKLSNKNYNDLHKEKQHSNCATNLINHNDYTMQ